VALPDKRPPTTHHEYVDMPGSQMHNRLFLGLQRKPRLIFLRYPLCSVSRLVLIATSRLRPLQRDQRVTCFRGIIETVRVETRDTAHTLPPTCQQFCNRGVANVMQRDQTTHCLCWELSKYRMSQIHMMLASQGFYCRVSCRLLCCAVGRLGTQGSPVSYSPEIFHRSFHLLILPKVY
jgi:hypothetical protein